MNNYQKFLEKINVISEKDFNTIMSSFPKIELDDKEYDLYRTDDWDEISSEIIEEFLKDFQCAYVQYVNFNDKEFELYDVQSLEELETIKNMFPEWNISNYEELKSDLENIEKEELEVSNNNYKYDIFDKIIDKVSIDELKKFAEKYGYKG